jgi:hypothetical protein
MLGVATAASIPALLFWRCMQSLGASPGLVLGAGVIYKLEERGRAMGIFFTVCYSILDPSPQIIIISFERKAWLLGPALAPLLDGNTVYLQRKAVFLNVLFLD